MTLCTVPVYRHGVLFARAIVDPDVHPWARSRRWTYATGHAVNKDGAMHRQILGLSRGELFVHHVNENGLDNRRENLRAFDSMSECSSQPHPLAAERAAAMRAERARTAA